MCLDILDKSTTKEWLLPEDKLPGKEQLNVVDVPKTSGILSEEEVFITDQDVAALLEAYQSGKWTVRQVVTAFMKKAVIMHQLVCTFLFTSWTENSETTRVIVDAGAPDELRDRVPR